MFERRIFATQVVRSAVQTNPSRYNTLRLIVLPFNLFFLFSHRAVEGTNVHTGNVVKAKLNLIDLAGSERISKTDATGDRLRCVAA